MFGFFRTTLKKVYTSFTSKISALFQRGTVDEAWLAELEKLLLSADTGLKTTRSLVSKLRERMKRETMSGERAHQEILQMLTAALPSQDVVSHPEVLLLVGVNGSGKTTFLGKLAHKFAQERKKVLLVAADTFRAAAVEQLSSWAQQSGVDIFKGKQNQDPASVVFDGCKTYLEGNYDHILIDTAGRLQTKVNLMNELAKIKRIISKLLPDKNIHTWLTIDSMLGQSSFAQAQVFNESTTLSGLVLTKYDGTGKGGILFSIVEELQLPVQYLTFGESINDLSAFDRSAYVEELLGE